LGFVVVVAILTVGPVAPALAGAPAPTLGQWQKEIGSIPTGGPGCYKADYPSLEWTSVPCTNVEPLPENVGGNFGDNEIRIQNPGTVSFYGFSGQFEAETGYTGESDSSWGNGIYSLQGNTNQFATTFNGNAANGWVQFVLRTDPPCWFFCSTPTAVMYMEFWLIRYPTTCPGGWTQWQTGSCYINSNAYSVPYTGPGSFASSHVNLASGIYQGQLSERYCSGISCWTTTANDLLGLAQNNRWRDVEFNVFGRASSSQAVFNPHMSLQILVLTSVTGGTPSLACPNNSFTAETNNLNVGTCTVYTGNYAIRFTESN